MLLLWKEIIEEAVSVSQKQRASRWTQWATVDDYYGMFGLNDSVLAAL